MRRIRSLVCLLSLVACDQPPDTYERWEEQLQRPLGDRVGPAPDDVLELITQWNLAGRFKSRPFPRRPDAPTAAKLRTALETLPPAVKTLAASRLAAVLTVGSLGSTGMSMPVWRDGRVAAGLAVLDLDMMRRTPDEWFRFVERRAYLPDSAWDFETELVRPGDDPTVTLYQLLILHELGHAVGLSGRIVPEDQIVAGAPLAAYPFVLLSWREKGDFGWVSRFDDTYPERGKIQLYAANHATLPGSSMLSVAEHLRATSFPTIYASTGPGDDFADSFTTYVHTQLLQRPYRVWVTYEGKRLSEITPCWGEPRCAEKQRMMAALFAP